MDAPLAESRTLLNGRAWTLVCGSFAVAAIVLFAYMGARLTYESQKQVRLIPWLTYDNRVDFAYFFAGAQMARHGDAAELYPEPGEWTFYPGDPVFQQPSSDYTKARLLARGNYYNPPALAYLQSPLTFMTFRAAYWIFCATGLAALLGFMAMAWRKGRQVPEMPLLIMGLFAFRPIHEAVIMGHMSLFFVLALAGGFFLLRAERPVLCGLVFSLLALKPQWAVLPGLFLLARGEWRALGSMAMAAAAIFFLPFLATGWHTFTNYFEFLRWSAGIDIKDAPHMFSWNGFLSKLNDAEVQGTDLVLYADAPPKGVIYGLVAMTALPVLFVWLSRDYLFGVAATVIAMLLVSTHSVWYDWALLCVAAVFMVLRSPQMSRMHRVEMWVVLLALFVSSYQSIGTLLYPDRHFIDWHRSAFYSVTPVAFASLVWMATVLLREGRLRLPFIGQRSLAVAGEPAA